MPIGTDREMIDALKRQDARAAQHDSGRVHVSPVKRAAVNHERFTPRPPRELHNVYAYLSTGAKALVAGELSWDGAQDRWRALDNLRLRVLGREQPVVYGGQPRSTGEVHVGDFIGCVQHFCVRSATDPDWPSGQPSHAVRVVLD